MNNLNFNIFNILIIAGVVHGIIFSIVVFLKKNKKSNNIIYLALVVLFLSLSNLQYWFLDTKLIFRYPIIKYIYIPFHWLVLPMFYFYVQKFIGKKTISNKVKVLLLAPFFIVSLIHLCQVFYKLSLNIDYEIPSHFKRGIFVYLEFLSVIFNVLIMYFTFKMITNHERDKTYTIKWVNSETHWLKKLIYTGLIVCAFWLIAITIVVILNLDESYIFYPMWIGISVLVYWIGYSGLNKSTQLYERIQLRKKLILELKNNDSKYNTISPDTFKKLESYIENNKAYLDSKLNLKSLAIKLKISEGYISQLISSNTKLNYNDYINSFRVEQAKKMLNNNDYNNYTILSIGLEAGFNSKSSFYSAFKKITNKTPIEYKKDVRNS